VALLYLADRTGWRFKRFDLFETVLRGQLKNLQESNVLIKVSFICLQAGLPLLMIFSSFLPTDIPLYFSSFSFSLILLLLLSWLIKIRMEDTLRLVWYVFLPFLIYQSSGHMPKWMDGGPEIVYNLSFWLLAAMAVFTLKFSKRAGFTSTPMDFLILFIALIAPNLPDDQIQGYQVGLVAAKIIILCFGYEILIGELRGNLRGIRLATLAALAVVGVKGLIQ